MVFRKLLLPMSASVLNVFWNAPGGHFVSVSAILSPCRPFCVRVGHFVPAMLAAVVRSALAL